MARPYKRVVPRPELIRSINGSFAWIDHRFLRDGHIERLTLEDLGVYVFLLLAANRDGVSWYRIEKVGRPLGLGEPDVVRARERLVERGLIAFQPFHPGEVNGFCQVLPLLEKPRA
jgi:hypothetical protein